MLIIRNPQKKYHSNYYRVNYANFNRIWKLLLSPSHKFQKKKKKIIMITTTYLLHLNEPLSMYNLLDLHPEHNHHKLGLIMSNNKLLETIY